MNYNKSYYRPFGLSLKELKAKKIPVQVAYMINEICNKRAIEWSDVDTEDKDIWFELQEVLSGEDFINWVKKLRLSVWNTEEEWEDFAYSLSEEEFADIKQKSVEELGVIVSMIISSNQYWIDKWSGIKNTNYLNIEMIDLAGKQYRETIFDIEDGLTLEDVQEKAQEVKDRFGLKSFKTTAEFSYAEVFNLLENLEGNLENITDVLGWDDFDFGNEKLSLTINLSDIQEKCHFDPELNIINLNLDGLHLLTEKFANALDYKLGMHLSNGSHIDFATQQSMNISLYSEEDSDIIKKSIKNKFSPKLKNYEKNNINEKIINSVPFLLRSLLTKRNEEPYFKAFIENRINDFNETLKSLMSEKNEFSEDGRNYNKNTWEKWSKDTLNFLEDEEIKKVKNYSAIYFYIKALIKMVSESLQDKIELSWSWLTIVYELEKNVFLLKQESGLIHAGNHFIPNKSSYTELFAKSFHSYISVEYNEDMFVSSIEGNLLYPQGNELNYEIKWWKSHIRYFNRIWKK